MVYNFRHNKASRILRPYHTEGILMSVLLRVVGYVTLYAATIPMGGFESMRKSKSEVAESQPRAAPAHVRPVTSATFRTAGRETTTRPRRLTLYYKRS